MPHLNIQIIVIFHSKVLSFLMCLHCYYQNNSLLPFTDLVHHCFINLKNDSCLILYFTLLSIPSYMENLRMLPSSSFCYYQFSDLLMDSILFQISRFLHRFINYLKFMIINLINY